MYAFVIGKFVRIVGLAVTVFLAGCVAPGAGRSGLPRWGEYGGKLDVLRAAYTPPQNAEESNYFIDLLSGSSVREFARAQGLVNNNAIFVLSHGKGVMTSAGPRYAFLPGLKGQPPAAQAMAFAPRDLAQVIGRDNARRIHNLVLAGCNTENMFYADELLQYFPAVTNIIHAEPRTDAYEATFFQVLTHHSSEIKGIFCSDEVNGMVHFGPTPRVGSRKLAPYMARLYKAGSRRLVGVQVAGRELLDPAHFLLPSSRPN